MRVIGIDPGTSSWDFYGIDTELNSIFLDETIPAETIKENPLVVIKLLKENQPFEILTAPSGYGIPLQKLTHLSKEMLFAITLRKPSDQPVMGLQAVLEAIENEKWNVLLLPSIKHLPTIPKFRKFNKIDLGTADKLCTAVVGIRDIMDRNRIECTEVNAIIVELGSAFSAIVAIEKGKIIDGIGGSNMAGFQACGSLDSELAYLIDHFPKEYIKTGGLCDLANMKNALIQDIIYQSKHNFQVANALQYYFEQIIRNVHAISTSFQDSTPPQYILLVGKIADEEYVFKFLENRLMRVAPVRRMKSYSKIAKQAAQGAAFIAEGLYSGPSAAVVTNLRIANTKGNILDDITFPLKLEDI